MFTILAGNLGSHHTNLDTNVFGGFALSDNIAPFIVVNDQDPKTAWSFTLMHEAAHLWLGATGISGGSTERTIERFCNDVATELLLPEAEIARDFLVASPTQLETLVGEIDKYAGACKVSPRLIAYRLLRRGSIAERMYSELGAYFYAKSRETRDKQREKARERHGGPSYYAVKKFRLGSALLSLTQRMLSSGELSTIQVGTALGVRALKVGNMFADSATAYGIRLAILAGRQIR